MVVCVIIAFICAKLLLSFLLSGAEGSAPTSTTKKRRSTTSSYAIVAASFGAWRTDPTSKRDARSGLAANSNVAPVIRFYWKACSRMLASGTASWLVGEKRNGRRATSRTACRNVGSACSCTRGTQRNRTRRPTGSSMAESRGRLETPSGRL